MSFFSSRVYVALAGDSDRQTTIEGPDSTRKLEDLKVLRCSPYLFNNVKKRSSQLHSAQFLLNKLKLDLFSSVVTLKIGSRSPKAKSALFMQMR